MISINEPNHVAEGNRHSGLLTDRVEQDMANALSEIGSQEVVLEADRAAEAPRISFGYGIPMAGVRYYSFTREG